MTMVVSNKGAGEEDTRLTKVFVGGLPWETPTETLKEHFDKFGEIVEAVVISDKLTGRSKGYGFVTFKEAEAAKKACEEAAVMINGRKANCNLASLGARRSPLPHTQPQGSNNKGGVTPTRNQVQWYYPTPPSPFQQHHPLPHLYGYTPAYIATDINYNYNQKQSYGNGGGYMIGHHSHVYPSHPMVGANTWMPMYPLYPHPHFHRTQTMPLPMGLPAHIYHPTIPQPFATLPPSITPNTGECYKRMV